MTDLTQHTRNHCEKRKEAGRINNTLHLWEFLLELLEDERYEPLISWTRKEAGEFKIKRQEDVAHKWGRLKQRASMNYDKLSRSLRYYYHKGIIKKVQGQRLVYKFDKLPYAYKPVKYNWPWKLPAEEQQEQPFNRDKKSFPAEAGRNKMSSWKVSQSSRLVRQVKAEFDEPNVSNTPRCAVMSSSRRLNSLEPDVKNEIPKIVPRCVPLATPFHVPVLSAMDSRIQSPIPLGSSPTCSHSQVRSVDYSNHSHRTPSQAICRSKIIFPPFSFAKPANCSTHVIQEVKSIPVRVITRIV